MTRTSKTAGAGVPRPVRVRDRMRPGAGAAAWYDSADSASARMRAAGLDAIPVVNGEGVIGLLERDAVGASRRGGNWLGAVSVASLMRRGAFACRAGDTVEHALATMDRLGAELLAVVDEAGEVVGAISRDRVATPPRPSLAFGAAHTSGRRSRAV
jgi:predicted transcriptional regulator